jgi:hypothetical protein
MVNKMENKLIILACGKANEVCMALETLVKTFGKNMTLKEIDYQVRLGRLNAIVRKQLNNEEVK